MNQAPSIAWREWSAETLAEARSSGRALLLAFRGGWDDRPNIETAAAADPALAELIAGATIAIAPDVDTLPELAARFEADAGAVLVVSPDGASVERPEPSDLRAALAAPAVPGRAAGERPPAGVAPPSTRMDLTPLLLDVATEAALEVPVTLGPEAVRLLIYTSVRREQAGPLERAADDLLRHASASSSVLRASSSGRLLLALGEAALADVQLHEELRATAVAIAEDTIALRDPSGGSRAWARNDGAVAPIVTAEGTARLARGLLHAGVAFDVHEWIESGARGVDFLVRELRAGQAGLYHAWDGSPGRLGWLGDQTAGVLALLEASEVTGDGAYRNQAIELMRGIEERWTLPDGRAVEYWSLDDQGGPFDELFVSIASNVELAEGRLWLGRLTHDERYLDGALDALTAFRPELERSMEAHAAYARVADRLLSAEPELLVVASAPLGEPDRAADPLLAAALRLRVAARSVQRLTAAEDADRLALLGVAQVPTGVAYVRVGSELSAPIDDAERLGQAVEETYLAFIG